MASLPSQPLRTASSSQLSFSEAIPVNNSHPPISKMDSEPILLNSQSATSSSLIPTPAASTNPSSQEVRTCWICQQDDVEDESDDVVWKAPCPCSLVAHELCLLDWIADTESPKKGGIARNLNIVCPQCKAVLDIRRPHDYLVQVYDKVHGLVADLAVPTVLSALLGCFYSGFLVYGLNTMQIVFGHDEARELLGLGYVFKTEPMMRRWVKLIKESIKWSMAAFDPFFPDHQSAPNWKVFAALPLIGPSLIISRTRFADQAFALLLPLYFLDPSHRTPTWPPTPGLAFSTLPYIRSFYNEIYRQAITPHEKLWDTAVQRTPRDGETAADVAAEAQEEDGGDPIFEIQIIPDDFEQPEAEGDAAEQAGEFPLALEQVIEAADAQRVDGNAAAPPADPRANRDRLAHGLNNWEIRQDFSMQGVLKLAMGALFFPTVAALTGDVLKYALPPVGKALGLRYAGRSSSFLKEKWGRTIMGGCLFVVLKDVITLYCKWKKARDFGKRKIMNYVGQRRSG